MRISQNEIDEFNALHRVAQDIEQAIRTQSHDVESLNDFVGQNKFAPQMLDRLSDPSHFELVSQHLDKAYANRKTLKLIARIEQKKQFKRNLTKWAIGLGSVAIVLFGVFLFNTNSTTPVAMILVENKAQQQSVPTLWVGDRTIDLSRKDSTLLHACDYSKQGVNPSNTQEMQRLIVPKGYLYTVILSDSTEVVVDAGSELAFPTRFDTNNREVSLKGQAYFKVRHADIPFTVNSGNMKVRVYGTQFNVNSTDQKIETILVEGAIGATIIGNPEIMIKPNQMLSYDVKLGHTQLSQVDPHQMLQWREGYFKYVDKPIEDVMADLSSWYGVTFELNNISPSLTVTIFAPRDLTLDEMLKLLSETTDVNFTLKGGGNSKTN